MSLARSLILLVPLWPLIGAALLVTARGLGGRSQGRFVALATSGLSAAAFGAGLWLTGWPVNGPLELLDLQWVPSRLSSDPLRCPLALDAWGARWMAGTALAGWVALLADWRPAHGST